MSVVYSKSDFFYGGNSIDLKNTLMIYSIKKRQLSRLAILTSLCFCLIGPIFAKDKNDMVGTEAPHISLFKLENNKYYRTKKLIGKKDIVLSFFATWCSPCLKEIPELHKLSAEMTDIEFVLVNVNEKRDKVAKHVNKKGYTLPVILDKYGVALKSFKAESLPLPLTVVIDKKGIITYYQSGYKPGDEKVLKNHLEKI